MTCASGDQRPTDESLYAGTDKFAEYFFNGMEDKDIMHRYMELTPDHPLYNTDPEKWPIYPCDANDAVNRNMSPDDVSGNLFRPDFVRYNAGSDDDFNTIPDPNEPNGGKSAYVTYEGGNNFPVQCDS